MPHKNTVRAYTTGGHYHIYNRGVEKRIIFKDKKDYNTFTSLLESYLTPKKPLGSEDRIKDPTYWRSKIDKDEVEILCYCLMPNHFHFLIKQNSKDGITKFMRRISNAYVRHFNKRHNRVGALFQGKFKACLIKSDDYLLHLSRYIHLNPQEVRPLAKDRFKFLKRYSYSSYPEYLNIRDTFWVKKMPILNFFQKTQRLFLLYKGLNSYQSFIESHEVVSREKLGELILD